MAVVVSGGGWVGVALLGEVVEFELESKLGFEFNLEFELELL